MVERVNGPLGDQTDAVASNAMVREKKPKDMANARHPIIDELKDLAGEARAAADKLKPYEKTLVTITTVARDVGRAWSQGWMGYHARVYIQHFQPARPDEYWDTNWGPDPSVSETRGRWAGYSDEDVVGHINERAGSPDLATIDRTVVEVGETFERVKSAASTIVAAIAGTDEFLVEVRKAIDVLLSNDTARNFVLSMIPQEHRTMDRRALSEGVQIPPHIQVEARCYERNTYAKCCLLLADQIERATKYLVLKGVISPRPAQGQAEESRTMPPATKTLNLLFMDLVGWSKLSPAQIAGYLDKALPKLNDVVRARFKATHLNTWGDAIVATFASAREAAECALDIRDFFRRTPEVDGVPQGLVPRISLHVGQVITAHNPLIGRDDIFGEAVHLAARLEPKTASGQVYCTKAFADDLDAVTGIAAAAHEVGALELAKHYGTIEVFVVTGPNEPPPPRQE